MTISRHRCTGNGRVATGQHDRLNVRPVPFGATHRRRLRQIERLVLRKLGGAPLAHQGLHAEVGWFVSGWNPRQVLRIGRHPIRIERRNPAFSSIDKTLDRRRDYVASVQLRVAFNRRTTVGVIFHVAFTLFCSDWTRLKKRIMDGGMDSFWRRLHAMVFE